MLGRYDDVITNNIYATWDDLFRMTFHTFLQEKGSLIAYECWVTKIEQ